MATNEEDLSWLIKIGQIEKEKSVEKAIPAPNEKDEEK